MPEGPALGHGGVPEGSQDKPREPKLEKKKGKEIFILGIEYLTKSAFSSIRFKMDVFKNSVKRTFLAQVFILTGKRSLKIQKIKEITKEKEKKRQENQKNEDIKRKGKNKNKKRKRKRK